MTTTGSATQSPPATKTLVQPYLFFGGRCEEALAFYTTALAARVDMIMHFKDSPQSPPPGTLAPGFETKVMHAAFRIGDSVLMASDGCGPGQAYTGFSLSLTLPTEDAVNRAFAALSEGGKIGMPLNKTFWSARFGMVVDRFGVSWMVMVAPEACR